MIWIYKIYYVAVMNTLMSLSNIVKQMSKLITRFAISIKDQAERRCANDY